MTVSPSAADGGDHFDQAMEQFLSQLSLLPGVRGAKSYVVLSTYVERPVQAEVTRR